MVGSQKKKGMWGGKEEAVNLGEKESEVRRAGWKLMASLLMFISFRSSLSANLNKKRDGSCGQKWQNEIGKSRDISWTTPTDLASRLHLTLSRIGKSLPRREGDTEGG